jgi:REP element-mobilizing transposase RayT
MPHSLSQSWIHIIFSTKNREPLLENRSIREKVHAYLAGICLRMNSPASIVGGIADHVHILCNQSKNVALKDLIQNIKQSSSKWIKHEWPELNQFYWQSGYGAFSVSPLHIDKVHRYIEDQEEHHQNTGFQEEFRSFLERYRIPYDERYLWD